MLKKLLQHNIVRDAIIICAGCLVFAVGFDCFEAKNGLAAGGATGLSLVIQQVVEVATGATIPIGLQVLVMNALLLIPVFRTGGLRYAARTVLGVIFSAFFTDALAPVLPNLGNGDLLLCALWGGVVTGLGLGLVFRVGGNTGGTDILAQLLAKHTPLTNGVAMFVDIFGYNSQLEFYRPRADINNDGTAAGDEPRMNWGIGQLPYNEGAGPADWSGGFSMSIPTGAANPDAAWEFLSWLQSTDGGQKIYTESGEIFPALQSVANSPVFMTDAPPASKAHTRSPSLKPAWAMAASSPATMTPATSSPGRSLAPGGGA